MNIIKTLLHAILVATLLPLLGGCASIGSSGHHQAVLLNSNPAGAQILVRGKVQGATPEYVLVPRSYAPVIELEYSQQRVPVELQTRYRWTKSFFPNLIFLQFAPVGWLIDFMTGAAWDVEDRSVVLLENGKKIQAQTPERAKPGQIKTVAIAPPISNNLGLSDAAGAALENRLKLDKSIQVRPYRQTLATFISNNYDFDGSPSVKNQGMLYYTLNVDAVYESEVTVNDEKIQIQAKMRDIYTKQTSRPLTLSLQPQGRLDTTYFKAANFFRFLPNTVGVDFVRVDMGFTDNAGNSISLNPPENIAWWEQGLSYISALSLTNLPARRVGRASRWQFSFTPSIRFSRKTVEARGTPDIDFQLINRTLVSGGYGPEVGFQISRHYLYLNIIPGLSWSKIDWTRDSRENSISRTLFSAESELGYLFFLNSNWNFRLFAKSATEDNGAWAEALNQTANYVEDSPAGARNITTGISIGYRFEPRYSTRSLK